MNEELLNEKFDKLCGERLGFTGVIDEIKKVGNDKQKKRISIVLVDVKEKGTNAEFRQHVHIMLNNNTNTSFFNKNINKRICFSAELYRYIKKPKFHEGFYYGKNSIGLKDIKNIKLT